MTVQPIADLRTSITTDLADNTTGDISAADVRANLADTVDTLDSTHGWAVYQDSTYTSVSPLVVNNAIVQLTIDGAGGATNTTYLPNGVTALWDTVNDKITPENVGDAYTLRLDFKAEMNTVNGYGELQLNVGGAVGDIVNRTITFAKGTGVAQNFSVGFPIFCLSTFVSNGGILNMDTTNGSNMDIYDIQIFISRINKGV